MDQLIQILKSESDLNRVEHKEILVALTKMDKRLSLVEYKASVKGAASGGFVALVYFISTYLKSKT